MSEQPVKTRRGSGHVRRRVIILAQRLGCRGWREEDRDDRHVHTCEGEEAWGNQCCQEKENRDSLVHTNP